METTAIPADGKGLPKAVAAAQATTLNRLTPAQFEELRQLSTCVTASAIERFRLRAFNTGFADPTIHCQFKELPPVLGYAATVQIRSAKLPMDKNGYSYYDRIHLWRHIETIPAPRIVVIEDIDEPAGLGAFVGAVHARIFQALGCVALVTNGSVRDINEIHDGGFQLFASNVTVSHAYAHVVDFGKTVSVGGLRIAAGDLVHGDVHGIQTIPLEVADRVPAMAGEILRRRKVLMEFCHADDFSVGKLQELIKQEAESRYPK